MCCVLQNGQGEKSSIEIYLLCISGVSKYWITFLIRSFLLSPFSACRITFHFTSFVSFLIQLVTTNSILSLSVRPLSPLRMVRSFNRTSSSAPSSFHKAALSLTKPKISLVSGGFSSKSLNDIPINIIK